MPMKKGTSFDRNPFADADRMRMTGDRIRALRNEKGLTQDKLIDELREGLPDNKLCNTSSIKNFEEGNSDPTASWLLALSKELDCDIDYLLRAHDQDTPRKASADMPDVTGMDSRACLRLQIPQERKHLGTVEVFSWFIENGLQEVIYNTEEEVDQLYMASCSLSRLPRQVRDLFESVTSSTMPTSDIVLLDYRYISALFSMEDNKLKDVVKCCEDDRFLSFRNDGEYDMLMSKPLYSTVTRKTNKKNALVREVYAYTSEEYKAFITAKEGELNVMIKFQNRMYQLLDNYRKATEPYRRMEYDRRAKEEGTLFQPLEKDSKERR